MQAEQGLITQNAGGQGLRGAYFLALAWVLLQGQAQGGPGSKALLQAVNPDFLSFLRPKSSAFRLGRKPRAMLAAKNGPLGKPGSPSGMSGALQTVTGKFQCS
jgi:hypothetical protein